MSILPLTTDLLKFRFEDDPETDPDWFTCRMRNYLRYEPDGCFALADDAGPIGMITAICYQRVGWLGWLFVVPGRRGQGFGAQLMRHGMGYCIARGMRSVVLEAVLPAAPLYRRLGFKDHFRTQHYSLGPDDFLAANPAPDPSVRVRPYAPQYLGTVSLLDERQFRQNRLAMIEILSSNPGFSGWVAERGGRVVGFLFMTETAANRSVGPFIVDPRAGSVVGIAARLLEAAFTRRPKPLLIRCPLLTPDRAEPLHALGARPYDYQTIRMFAGDPYPPEGDGVLSLGCPGKG